MNFNLAKKVPINDALNTQYKAAKYCFNDCIYQFVFIFMKCLIGIRHNKAEMHETNNFADAL